MPRATHDSSSSQRGWVLRHRRRVPSDELMAKPDTVPSKTVEGCHQNSKPQREPTSSSETASPRAQADAIWCPRTDGTETPVARRLGSAASRAWIGRMQSMSEEVSGEEESATHGTASPSMLSDVLGRKGGRSAMASHGWQRPRSSVAVRPWAPRGPGTSDRVGAIDLGRGRSRGQI
jgi:hypothetical protein